MARRCASLKDLDDDHAAAAAWTGWLVGVADGLGRLILTILDGEQLAHACDIVGACPPCEQAVVADAVETLWQHVDEEAADELVCGERHSLLTVAALDAVILPSEGDAVLVEGDQAAVGDGDAVGIARQIGQHGLWTAERTLGIDDPFPSCAPLQAMRRMIVLRRDERRCRRSSGAWPGGGRQGGPGTGAGTGVRARAPAGRTPAGRTPSAGRRARCRRPARSCAHAGGGSWPSPRCAVRT